jgi:lipopolysaccharide transport system permease protein
MDTMARMALRADASKFFLGYVWWILEPLLYVLVFYLVFNVVLESKRGDFLIFLMTGKLPFIWFSKSVNQAAISLLGGAGLISKINIPKSLFPMATIQEGMYKQATVFVLLFIAMIAAGFVVTPAWLYLIPLILVNYMVIVACGLIAASLVCVVRDFSMVINLAIIFLMFTSGIFWDVRALEDPRMTELVLTFNPLAFILDGYRQILMNGVAPDMLHLGIIGAAACAVAYGMILIMRNASQYLALRALTA